METVFKNQDKGYKELLQIDKKKIKNPIELSTIYRRAFQRAKKYEKSLVVSEVVRSAWKKWKRLIIPIVSLHAEKGIFTYYIVNKNIHFIAFKKSIWQHQLQFSYEINYFI